MGANFERPEGYMPRVADAQIERYLKAFGAVEIAGTKWCGKTWSALMHGASVSYVDENLDLARADPSMMLMGDRPHVIDEWQRVPAIWDCVRHEVDRARGTRGAFILTGSSTPATRQGEQGPAHSGAGRIGRVRMSPMSLFESGESTGQVSLEGLFAGEFTPCVAERDTQGLVEAACRGGWPEAVGMEVDAAQLIAREYVTAALGVSIPALGLDPDIARRLASSLARNLGQAATYKTIINDMFGAEENPLSVIDEGRVRVYLDALKGMYIVEEVPGWAPPARDRKRFATKPKRYLADPSLACALLGMSPAALLADWQTFGLVFENMAVRDLSVYARALDLLDDVSRSSRLYGWRRHVQQAHRLVVAERVGLHNLHRLKLFQPCLLGDLVLSLVGVVLKVSHVGDVPHVADLVAKMPEQFEKHIVGYSRTGVSEVSLSVDRRPADVHSHVSRLDRLEKLFRSSKSICQK